MFEKVNPGHPDKLADRIAGAIVDLAYTKDADPKVAAEVLIGHGHCHIINETSEVFSRNEIEEIVHRIAGDHITVSYAEYLQDEHLSDNQKGRIRCGDNGIFRGVPLTDEQKELSGIARTIYLHFPTDGKYLIDQSGKRLVICQSNAEEDEILKLLSFSDDMKVEINPLGYWTGGIDVDSGATNRKLGSDMGDSLTGGGLWGKDLSKADITLNLYAWKYAQILNETVEIMCAIGDEEVIVAEGSGKKVKRRYEDIIEEIRAEIFLYYGGFEKFAEWGYF